MGTLEIEIRRLLVCDKSVDIVDIISLKSFKLLPRIVNSRRRQMPYLLRSVVLVGRSNFGRRANRLFVLIRDLHRIIVTGVGVALIVHRKLLTGTAFRHLGRYTLIPLHHRSRPTIHLISLIIPIYICPLNVVTVEAEALLPLFTPHEPSVPLCLPIHWLAVGLLMQHRVDSTHR